MLDHLTAPIDTGLSVDRAVEEFVDRILREHHAPPRGHPQHDQPVSTN